MSTFLLVIAGLGALMTVVVVGYILLAAYELGPKRRKQ